jgi:copper chaperone
MHHLHIPDMHCGGCLRAIERAIQRLDPQAQVEGDLERRVISVRSSEEKALLQGVLAQAGYPALSLSQQDA